MHSKQLLSGALLLLLSNLASSQTIWTTSELPTPRVGMAGVYAGGKVFYAGGYTQVDPSFVGSKKVDIYDIATGTWTTEEALGQARSRVAAAAVGNKVLFAGGSFNDADFTGLVDVYDLTTGTWSQTNLPGGQKRSGLAVAVVGDKAYFGGGTDGDSAQKEVFVYDGATSSWGTTLQLPTARKGAVATAVGSKLLFACGRSGAIPSVDLTSVDIYDTATETWSMTSIPVFRSGISALTVGSKAYFVAGITATTGPYKDMHIYDPSTNAWVKKNLSDHRWVPAVGQLNNRIYVAGGDNTSFVPLKSVDVFNTVTAALETAQTLSVARNEALAVSTPDRILFAGGFQDPNDQISNVVDILSLASATHSPQTTGEISISPTLASESVILSVDDELDVAPVCEVMDFTGRTRSLFSVESVGAGEWQLPTADLPAGVWLVRLSHREKTWVGRFVKAAN